MQTLLWIFLMALGFPVVGATAPGAPSAAPEDPVLDKAKVFDGTATRTVSLRPLRPVSYLNERLQKGDLPGINAEVVRTLLTYPRNGEHRYWWPKKSEGVAYDGATTDVIFQGKRVMRGEPKGRTFCCGLTLEVAYRILDKQPHLAAALTSSTAQQFQDLWFCEKINSPGPEDAMREFGLGRKIPNFDDAQPGDFVQIWRNDKTGHSVIFVAWAYDPAGKRVGFHYWSTQIPTKCINFRTELFGTGGKTVSEKLLSIARLEPGS